MSDFETGWVWTDGHIVGSLASWRTEYGWDGDFYETKAEAIHWGLELYGSDDFNIAHVINGEVAWWGWMSEEHPLSDAEEFARQYSFRVAVEQPS